MEDECITQTKSHFEHADQVKQQVNDLCTSSIQVTDDLLKQLSIILDIYQEQSHLLDPYLEDLVTPIMTCLRERIQQRPIMPENTHHLFRFLYLLTKTRGYKTIVKFMSHEVTDLESVFHFLSNLDDTNIQIWETRYICFVWLSLICMIPFDLKRVDSGSDISLITRLLDLCKYYLKATGKERDGASLLVARLLSRRDLCDDYLVPFVEWSKMKLAKDAEVFETAGILSSLCTLYQFSPRKVLLPTLDDSIFPLLSMPFFDKYDNNSLIRKLRMKLTQRVGLCYLKPKLASWRYQRGSRSLRNNLDQGIPLSVNIPSQSDTTMNNENDDDEDISEHLETIIDILLNGLRDKDTIVRWSAAKGMGRITQRLPQELAEDVIGSLLELFEENTFKPKGCDELDLTAVSDHTWHGVSLAVAELARRGLLLPARLEETIPWIILGLKFDLKRGSHSIGAHVRDAACYVCWSFARAYAPEIMAPFVKEVAQNLVVVSVFDREINVRRASSAAFQENVGRQGIFPMGIDIIQLADYFSLGNRTNSFLQVAVAIAKFEDYRYHLIDHLVTTTSKHWDKSMRVLASKTLYQLVPLDPVYFMDQVLPSLVPLSTSKDMIISHGALLSLGEICFSLWECRQQDEQKNVIWNKNETLIQDIAGVVAKIPSRSLSTFGSEHIREATCQLVEYMCRIRLIDNDKENTAIQMIDGWKRIIQTSLERKEENVQEYAVGAFGALSRTYGIQRSEVDIYLKKIETTHMMYGRRGYALALGTLDYNMEERYSWLHDVLHQLGLATRIQVDHIANDVEAKRNAVIGLTTILKGLNDTTLIKGMSLDDHLFVIDTLESCLKDYSTDQRGDVGSWVRSASMECIRYYMPLIARLDTVKVLSNLDTNGRMISMLMKQSVERIDRVRGLAGSVLVELVSCDAIIIPHHDKLKELLTSDLSFSTPGELYPVMVDLLYYPSYRLELLTGLIASAGGLTESLVRHASSCLIEFINKLPPNTNDTSDNCSREDIIRTMYDIFARYEKQDRVIIPLMDVIGLLYETGSLSVIENETIHLKLMTLVRKESFKAKNVKKLLSTIKIYVGFISLSGTQVKIKALQQMLSYLVHGYPRIRMEVADQLFTFLSVLNDDEMTDGTMQAEEIITGTDWSMSIDEIKPLRDQLYDFLGIPKPVVRPSK
ncbi:tubulin-specific chaperone D-like protein [Halteromyces radiatus]|uniref:tubulin-specific chaperone D-like protein n=1 Tax=Halteromyces radiatus TaxID=101107 RepID=UPI00221FD5A0|nr:tubulin-specific chaperone D-like protein [Halteromyces radiatus]KAI8082900.1 tubulin-specific chaperone D-like protein [Halteromyces radiatus]